MIIDPDFTDHWKTRMLVDSLSDEAAPVYVLRIWAHCQSRKKTHLENFSAEALKALCHFPGQGNKLESSLVASGFVSRSGKHLTVIGWEEHNAKLVASWRNGEKGGRPLVPDKPNTNPIETQGEPIPSYLLSVLEGIKSFNSEIVRIAIRDWAKHFHDRVGRKFSATKLTSDLMEASRKGWSDEQLEASIRFSISKDAKSWLDPAKDFEKRSDHAGGEPETPDEKFAKIKEAERRAKR